MDSLIYLHANDTWRPAATLTVTGRQVRFEYLAEYVFGDGIWPVALGLPVNMEIVKTASDAPDTPLAFLWDLVPQGRGRRHLANLLGVPEQDPTQDLFLAQHGAFAPIGRLRMDTALRFYQEQVASNPAPGFTLIDMVERTDLFLEQLTVHSMLAAGTPGVQGVAPKFLLTQDEEGLWFPDMALPDARARLHWIVKLPRGQHETDYRILQHEAIYLQAAGACGLRTYGKPMVEKNMLFLPRFDRRADVKGVTRLHQETLASVIGAAGFGRSASLFTLTEQVAQITTCPEREVTEFLCRDVLNRALRNPDNHLRNTSVQQLPDGTVQLTPIYDLAPMYLDRELITRTCAWTNARKELVDDWNSILEQLQLDDAVKAHVVAALRAFGQDQLPRLSNYLREMEADPDIILACEPAIEQQIQALSEIDYADHATPKP